MIAATTADGLPHAEYIAVHGAFVDLPLPLLFRIFVEAYGAVDVSTLKAAGVDMNNIDVAEFAALLGR